MPLQRKITCQSPKRPASRGKPLYKQAIQSHLHSHFSSPLITTMASSRKKLLSAFFILSLLLLQVFAQASLDTVEEGGEVAALNCSYACARRCREASRKNVCGRACHTCCTRCQCVPPGTYGNKNACPCYASLKTHGHKPKCP